MSTQIPQSPATASGSFGGTGQAPGWSQPESPTPPYGLCRLLEHADEVVYVDEGEKDADRLKREGLIAISVEAGHENTSAEHLAGRDVIILPDNDDAGEKRADKVRAAVQKVAASLRLVRLPGLRKGGDVSDWFDAGRTVSDLIEVAGEAAIAESNARVARGFTLFCDIDLRISDIDVIDGVLPQTGVGALYAASGLGKTFLALDMALSVGRGQPFALIADLKEGYMETLLMQPSGTKILLS